MMRARNGNQRTIDRRDWTRNLLRLWRGFAAAKRGSVAMTFGLSFIPLMIAVGVGIDLGRVYIVKEKLLHTTDAAGLAIGAAFDSGQDLSVVLSNYFTANFPAGGLGTVTASSYTYVEPVITVTATATVETTFMQIAGINSVTVNATSQITRQENSLEVVMVLDNSGSMSGSKLTSLKSAAQSLVDILFGNETTPANLKIGLVPFSNNVNIDPTNTAYVSNSTNPNPPDNWGTTSWGGCVLENVTSDNDTKDDFTGPWEVMYWEDDSNNNWISSGGSFQITSSRSPNLYCPSAAITPLTNNKTTLTTAISNLVANGGTHINLGAIWGWRVISPSEPFTQGVAYATADNTKAVIILSDGENTAYSFVYDAYKYPSDNVLGTTSASGVAAALNTRLSTICTNMKAAGIIVYTIMFDLSDATTEALFQACATDTGKYYNSPTSAELDRAFRAIAAELKKLRITG